MRLIYIFLLAWSLSLGAYAATAPDAKQIAQELEQAKAAKPAGTAEVQPESISETAAGPDAGPGAKEPPVPPEKGQKRPAALRREGRAFAPEDGPPPSLPAVSALERNAEEKPPKPQMPEADLPAIQPSGAAAGQSLSEQVARELLEGLRRAAWVS